MSPRSYSVSLARLRRAATATAALAAAFGLMGLLGWITGLRVLQMIVEGRPAMMPNTAVCIILAAAAIVLLGPERPGRLRRAASRACAAIVLVLGLATFLEYTTGLDLRVDRIFLALSATPEAPPVGASPEFPGRPAAPTAAALTLLAAALLLIDVRWRGRNSPAELLALAAGVVSHAVLTGHAYDAEVLFRSAATGTALHTAFGLALLSVGVLLVRPERGMMGLVTSDTIGGTTARRLLAPAIVGPPLLGFVVLAGMGGEQALSLSHALLATASATIATALLLVTAGSLNRVDAARRRFEEESLRWRSVADSAEEAIVAETLDGIVLCWNPASERIFGWSATDMLGCSMLTIVPEDRRAELTAARERVGRGEHVAPFETVRVHRDGTRIDVAVSMSPVFDAGERLLGVSTIARDIRARKAAETELARAHAAERALRMKLEALSAASAAISDAVARIPKTDLDAVLLAIVLEARTLTHARYAAVGLGTDPTRPFDHWVHVGMTDEQVAAIGRRPRPVGLLGEVIRRGRPIRLADVAACPVRVGYPPGHVAMRSFLGAPILYAGHCHGNLYLGDRLDAGEFTEDDERVLEFLAARAGTALETARLYRKEALAKSWLQGIIDGMPEAVLLTDASGKISCNEAARQLNGCESEPDGPPQFDLRDPSGAPVAGSDLPLARALQGEACSSRELVAHRRHGASLPVLASASPLHDGAGRIVGAVCVLRDISALKEIERMRQEWTAIVAHDLRQPLSIISMSAQIVEHACSAIPNPPVWRALARIHTAADRLARMVRDLLDTTRLEAHQLKLELESIDLEAVLGEVAARAGLVAHWPLRLQVAGPLPRVRADTGRVEQVLDNLLSNAFKYGDPDTEVVLAAEVADGEVVLSTTNRGRELSQEDVARLFTRFYRAPSAGSVEGLGLGLYITKGLVEAHGGRIWVESAEGTTTFRFTLPIAVEIVGR